MLEIEPTDRTPLVRLDGQHQLMRIAGESWPENVTAFYGHVSEALTRYFQEGERQLEVHIDLVYFNSGTARALGDMMRQLDQFAEAKHKVALIWHCDKSDDIAHEFAEDISAQLRFVQVDIKETQNV